MKDEIQEQVSALVDDELEGREREFLLRRLEHDASLRERWESYHLISDAMRYNLPPAVDVTLADRIMAEIEGTAGQAAGSTAAGVAMARSSRSRVMADSGMVERLLRPLAGLAVAASLAVASLFGVQNLLQHRDSDSGAIHYAGAAVSPSYVRTAGTRWDTGHADVEHRLTGYLVNHSEYASATSLQGMAPYVRIAGYDVRR